MKSFIIIITLSKQKKRTQNKMINIFMVDSWHGQFKFCLIKKLPMKLLLFFSASAYLFPNTNYCTHNWNTFPTKLDHLIFSLNQLKSIWTKKTFYRQIFLLSRSILSIRTRGRKKEKWKNKIRWRRREIFVFASIQKWPGQTVRGWSGPGGGGWWIKKKFLSKFTSRKFQSKM